MHILTIFKNFFNKQKNPEQALGFFEYQLIPKSTIDPK